MSNLPEDLFYERYIIASFEVILPGEEPEKILTNHINSFAINKNYDTDCFPIFSVNLSIKTLLYYKIISHKEEVKFRIRLDKYVLDPDKPTKISKNVFNELFSIYINEDTPFMDKTIYENTKNIDGGTTGPTDFLPNVELYLFKDKDLTNSKAVANKIVKNASLMTAVAYLLSNAGFNKVLMDSFDNKSPITDLILPPFPLVKTLYYLEGQFGYYSTGSVIFFDYDCAYFLKKQSKCTAFRPKEYKQTVFTVYKSSNPESTTPGFYEDEKTKKYYINIAQSSIEISTNSIVLNQLEGHTHVQIDPVSGNTSKQTLDMKRIGKSALKVDVNTTSNPYKQSMENTERLESAVTLNVTAGDFDMDAITPNKEFLFVFEDQEINSKYGGKYRVSTVSYTFKKSGDEFMITGNLTMKRTP